MSESDLNTYKLQLQQVEAALTTDPDNVELSQLKGDLEQVLNLTQDLINQQLGAQAALKEEDESELEPEKPKKQKKSRWTEDPLIPVKPWQVGENCLAIYSEDGAYHDAKIEDIAGNEVTVKFKGYRGTFVTTLGLLKLPNSGTTTVHATSSAKNKKELSQSRSEYLKEKKAKKKAKWEAIEKEGEKEKKKWTSFSNKAFGKKGFVKKSIFKTPEAVEGKVGVGTMGIGGKEMTEFSDVPKYRKGQ